MILTAASADKMLRRMALEIAEHNFEKESLIIIGIKENGIVIAEKIVQYLGENFPGTTRVIALGIDKRSPGEISLSENLSLKKKTVILADDVANSGRTMLYAMKPLLDQRPVEIQTLALVERTHKLFPVALTYCGISVSTSREENIAVGVENGIITGADFNNINKTYL